MPLPSPFLVSFRALILRKKVLRRWIRYNRVTVAPDGGRAPVALAPKRIPRVIWMFWAQGEAEAPPLVQACIRSWRERNPGWEVRVLDRENISEYTPTDDIPETASMSHFSDIVRLSLLTAHGGVWADATTYCSLALDMWTGPLSQSGFFCFAAPHPDRMISSWFLLSEKGGEVVSRWSEQARRYWKEAGQADHYLWVHYLFEWLVKSDRKFAAQWKATPRLSADGPHLMRRCLEAGVSADELAREDIHAIPIHKLTWKAEFDPAELAKWGVDISNAAPKVATRRARAN